jgi:hypothetical protein
MCANMRGGTTTVTYHRRPMSALWAYIKGKADSVYQAKGSYAASNHTHNYAGSSSAGGSATSAVKLDTATAGSTKQPVYFTGGKPTAIGYTIESNVPANAKFTDTNTWRGVQNNLTSTATDQSLAAAQGKWLNENKTPQTNWSCIIKCATWSRICYVAFHTSVTGSFFLLNVAATRSSVVYNETFAISVNHSQKSSIVKIGTAKYSAIQIRVTSDANGNCYVELYDNAQSATNSTTQSVTCRLTGVRVGAITTYTAFTDGSTLASGFVSSSSLTVNANSIQGNLTWGEITGKPSTFTPASHTHNYAGSSSAGGSATSAVKLDTSTAGSTTQPVYFSGGKPVAIGYTIATSVPSGAKFTDTNTWRGIQDNLTSSSATDSLSAKQGKWLMDNKAAGQVLASDVNLNNVTTPGIYSCGGGNTITNKPSGLDAIGLIVVHNATGSYYTQILTTSTNTNTYRRNCVNGTWNAWTVDKYSDTNTHVSVVDNLTSTSTTTALSANQGKVLKGLVDGKAASSHTHTKSQITDFPTSLKNPSALTIQGNGTTLKTYDGSSAQTVNITKSSIGLGSVDNTADSAKTVAKANQLTTTRTVSGGTDVTMSFTYNGSADSSASIGFYSCNATGGNTSNYPWHRIAKLDTITGSYVDKSVLLYLTQGYQGGGFGLIRVTLRTNSSSSVSAVEARWLVRSGFSADQVQVGLYNVYGKTYADIFLKIGGYGGTVIRAIGSDARGGIGRTWTLVSSNEANDTTTSDAKTSKECWATIAAAATALHSQAYTNTVAGSDNGNVSYANSAGSASTATTATKVGTATVGSATRPVYINGGTPTAGTYTLGNACAKTVRTLTAAGASGWKDATTDQGYVPDMAFIAYWNGAYSGTSSNLSYCSKGAFGTAITLNKADVIKSLSISGKTITYTKGDGTTGTLTTQDTNTWRGIQNNLTSTSTTDSLSAAQGKALNDALAKKVGASVSDTILTLA